MSFINGKRMNIIKGCKDEAEFEESSAESVLSLTLVLLVLLLLSLTVLLVLSLFLFSKSTKLILHSVP